MPIGSPNADAATMSTSVPTIAFAMPPPASPGGLWNLREEVEVDRRRAGLAADGPRMKIERQRRDDRGEERDADHHDVHHASPADGRSRSLRGRTLDAGRPRAAVQRWASYLERRGRRHERASRDTRHTSQRASAFTIKRHDEQHSADRHQRRQMKIAGRLGELVRDERRHRVSRARTATPRSCGRCR